MSTAALKEILGSTISIKNAQIIGSGSHSKVYSVENNNTSHVFKIIGSNENIFPTKHEATDMVEKIIEYDQILNNIGLPTPKIIDIGIYTSELTGFHQIFIITTYEGNSLEYVLLTGSLVECFEVTNEILRSTQPLFDHKNDGELVNFGFDIKPANYTNNGQQLIYVDSYPPRINGALDFPEPQSNEAKEVAYFRSFTIPGILLTLQNQLSRLRPEFRPMFKKIILAFANRYGVDDFFRESLFEKFIYLSDGEKVRIIKELGPEQMYTLREIACELAARDSIKKKDMENIFHLTHFKGDVSPESWQNAKTKILKLIL